MTIYTDAINNYYLGEATYANLDPAFSSTSYTSGEILTGNNINSQLISICTSLGISYQLTGDFSYPSGFTNAQFEFTPVGDSVAGNKRFGILTNGTGVNLYGNRDYEQYLFIKLASFENTFYNIADETSSIFQRQMLGVFNQNSVAICYMRRHPDSPGTHRYIFLYACTLDDVIYPMFNSSYLAKSLIFWATNYPTASTHLAGGRHFFVPTQTSKLILDSGDAFYPIVCADAQTPGTNHLSDFYARYNDSAINNPRIGKLPNVIYAQGTYILGKPVKINGSVFPDLGHNHWLPVARWGTYTLLMRCYSSLV